MPRQQLRPRRVVVVHDGVEHEGALELGQLLAREELGHQVAADKLVAPLTAHLANK